MSEPIGELEAISPQDLLPQKGTMALIRRILAADLSASEPWVRAEVVVGPEALSSEYSPDQVLAPVGIEYVAQAGAVLGGLLARKGGSGGPVRGGMIGAVREVQLYGKALKRGQVLHVVARLLAGDEQMSSIQGELYAAEESEESGLLMSVRCSVVHQ
jgi:predicted hotdog family 3-hydroxylacyl-ACP dehydratase